MEDQPSKRTEYDALKRFATVTASTQSLTTFARQLWETPKQNWDFYFSITTGKAVKAENKKLLCQVINFARLMEILEIKISPAMLRVSLNLSIIERMKKMPPVEPNFELYISKDFKVLDTKIDGEIMKDYGIKLENLWALWFYEVQLTTYAGGEVSRRIPHIFLKENAEVTQKRLLQKSGKHSILRRIVEWNNYYPGEITELIEDVWNQFPALRPEMIKLGYQQNCKN